MIVTQPSKKDFMPLSIEHHLKPLRLGLLLSILTSFFIPLSIPAAQAVNTPLLGGYFIYSSSNQTTMDEMLDGVVSTGADTVITFGTRLKPTALSAGRPSSDAFANCLIDGQGCVDAVAAGLSIRTVFTYEESSTWYPSNLCPGERTFTAQGKTYSVLLIPTDSSGCTGSSYDVVVSADAVRPEASKTSNLLRSASARGVNVFLGMPAPIQRTDAQPWLPDVSYLPTLGKFTQRWLSNVNSYSGAPSGFYHHTEMPLKASSGWDSVLSVYRTQNEALAAVQPGKPALVSPYIDARRSSTSGTPLSQVGKAALNIINTSSGVPMIIAPQDGQGTGKVGAYSSAMINDQVDAPSAAVAGAGRYKDIYEGSSGDYMRAIVKEVGTQAQVWVNIELMTASTSGAPSCDSAPNGRGKASIDRVQRQVGVASVSGVTKTISFMWTPYVTCGGSEALLGSLQQRPGATHMETSPVVPISPSAPKSLKPRVPSVALQIQNNLLTLGYHETGDADGIGGPQTSGAISTFQSEAGYEATGAIDQTSLLQTAEKLAQGWTRPLPAAPTPPAGSASPPAGTPPLSNGLIALTPKMPWWAGSMEPAGTSEAALVGEDAGEEKSPSSIGPSESKLNIITMISLGGPILAIAVWSLGRRVSRRYSRKH